MILSKLTATMRPPPRTSLRAISMEQLDSRWLRELWQQVALGRALESRALESMERWAWRRQRKPAFPVTLAEPRVWVEWVTRSV